MLTLLVAVFLIGYVFITLEHPLKINKSATALVMGGVCWMIFAFIAPNPEHTLDALGHHTQGIAEIMLFLVGAMTIVELIDSHDGFQILVSRIKVRKKSSLLWVVGLITFFLSAVLDNLTASIVMVSLLRKFMGDANERKLFAGIIIIAANAGGAFSPIGDVTTTMLWVGGRISTQAVITKLFLPSLVCLIIPIFWLSLHLKGTITPPTEQILEEEKKIKGSKLMLMVGIVILLLVPVFKQVTHLPPFLGMLLGLGIIWILADILHKHEDFEGNQKLSANYALTRIDVPSILFFFGILAAVATLEESHLLHDFAGHLQTLFPSERKIALVLGLLSAVVDNVPLVAATIGMYDLKTYPIDAEFWHLIAYCAGTGGSVLIIGSAAGITVMGMERISFVWYLKNISFLALLGYLAGMLTYILLF